MSTGAVTLFRSSIVSTGRSNLEIDQELSSTLQKIREEIDKRLSWYNTIRSVAKNLVNVKTLPKIVFCMGVGSIEYLLIRGTFAGIEVDFDSNFTDLFSSNKETRLATGLNLTNGDQAGQFIFDGAQIGVLTYYFVFREPYYKFVAQTINESYEPHLSKLLEAIGEIKAKISIDPESENQLIFNLVKSQEEVNRLYKRLRGDLKPYGGEPLSYKKQVLVIPQHSSEVRVQVEPLK